MTEPAVLPAPRRRRRWWLLLLVPPALLVAFWLYLSFAAQQRLARALAETDRLDPHWRLDDLQAERPIVPDEENAALLVIAVKGKMPPNWNPDLQNMQTKALPGRLKPNEALTQQQTAAVRAWLEPCAAVLLEARRLADLPRARWPDGPPLFDALETARLLSWDALLRAEEGDLDGALASCRGAVNDGRAVGEQPSVMAQLMRLAIASIAADRVERVLGLGEPSDAALAALQDLLAEEGQASLFTIAFRGERASQDQLLESLQRGETSVAQLKAKLGAGVPRGTPPSRRVDLYHLPGVVASNRAAMLERMNKLVEVSKLPSHEQTAPLSALLASAPNELLLNRLVGVDLSPILMARYMEDARVRQAQIRCAAVGLAVERYRRKHGRWPDGLDDLKDEFLADPPPDPFNGQPLHYDRNDEGVVVCSAGTSGKYDVRFRLWHVTKRRQPPSPPESRR